MLSKDSLQGLEQEHIYAERFHHTMLHIATHQMNDLNKS